MSWLAEQLGINMAELETERPLHPKQIRVHIEHNKRADAYWKVPVNIRDTPADLQDLKTTRL